MDYSVSGREDEVRADFRDARGLQRPLFRKPAQETVPMTRRSGLTLAVAPRATGTDEVLLREFVSHRSQSAFAELLQRYGPMVFGVCRRSLSHTQDAEDAFQATFLVLARRAAHISAPEKLPGWLHRVAVRTATEIRHMRNRRPSASLPTAGTAAAVDESVQQRELASVLDCELAALPDHYRLPVVLCELRGLNRKQAAGELKIPEGTLSSRLAKARKLLGERLAKHGYAASIAGMTATLANIALAQLPIRLVLGTVESAVSGAAVTPAVTLAADTVVKVLFATKLKGFVLAGGLFLVAAAGLMVVPGGADAQPDQGRVAQADEIAPLVKQLGSRDFAQREAAEKKLKAIGPKALPALRAGLKSDLPEVAQRSESVIAAIRRDDADRFAKAVQADTEYKQTLDHPIWTRWEKVVGDDRGSRELFTEMLTFENAAMALSKMDEDSQRVPELYVSELERVQAQGRNISLSSAAYAAYLGTFDGTGDALKYAPEKLSRALLEMRPLQALGEAPYRPIDGEPGVLRQWHEKMQRMKPSIIRLYNACLSSRCNQHTLRSGFDSYHGYADELLPAAKVICRRKELSIPSRIYSFKCLGAGNALDFLPDIKEFQLDEIEVLRSSWGNEFPANEFTVQARDVAVAVQLLWHKQDLLEFGFVNAARAKNELGANPNALFKMVYQSFPDDASRNAAHAKALAFLKTAPVPKAKAVLPKKWDRVPEPSPELRKELATLDKDYRHGTPEKFAELENKAAELAKQFSERDDQARIWYEVAHMAAQSDIGKQASQVRKYAAKSLEISRDPLQRGTLYSYLASAEEVSEGVATEKRRKAADWLLTGYLELLVQELPDQAPELLGVGKFDVDGPGEAQARAQHAAQVAAREQAKFVRNQVERRDVLVQQLRGLFKLDPDELKALATKKLPDDAAVTELIKRVMK